MSRTAINRLGTQNLYFIQRAGKIETMFRNFKMSFNVYYITVYDVST